MIWTKIMHYKLKVPTTERSTILEESIMGLPLKFKNSGQVHDG